MSDDQEEAPLPVLDKEVLRMAARDLLLDGLGLGHGEDRHVLVGPRRDAETAEKREEVVAGNVRQSWAPVPRS
jgi:hypothetical protein